MAKRKNTLTDSIESVNCEQHDTPKHTKRVLYVVMMVSKKLTVAGIETPINGVFGVIPAFETYDQAKDYAGDKYEIMEVMA